jgi:hypothetical protein
MHCVVTRGIKKRGGSSRIFFKREGPTTFSGQFVLVKNLLKKRGLDPLGLHGNNPVKVIK